LATIIHALTPCGHVVDICNVICAVFRYISTFQAHFIDISTYSTLGWLFMYVFYTNL
jgi:hypothetical protein